MKNKILKYLEYYNIKCLPQDLSFLNYMNIGLEIMSYSEGENFISSLGFLEYSKKHNGFSMNFKDKKIIFFNNSLSQSDINFIIAHEIGHIWLGHTIVNNIYGESKTSVKKTTQEIEANRFAAAFISFLPSSNDKIEEKETISLNDNYKTNERTFSLKYLKTVATVVIISLTLLAISIVLKKYTSQSLPALDKNNVPVGSVVTPDIDFNKTETALVYKTKYSNKIHLSDCQYVKNKTNVISLNYNDALEAEFEPCKVCKPNKWFSLDN